jgi:MFS family permease
MLLVLLVQVAIGLGALAWGPFSDRYGRKPALVIATALFALTNVPLILAPNIAVLLAFRTLQVRCRCCWSGSSVWCSQVLIVCQQRSRAVCMVQLHCCCGECAESDLGSAVFVLVLQGAAIAAYASAGPGMAADICSPANRGTMFGVCSVAALLGPVIGPPLGGGLAQVKAQPVLLPLAFQARLRS